MEQLTHGTDTGRIQNKNLAQSMATAANAEIKADLLRNPNPNSNVEDVSLTAGVVDLIGNPHELATYVKEYLQETGDTTGRNAEELAYGTVSPETLGRIAATLAMTTGLRTRARLAEESATSQPAMSKVINGLITDGYIDDNNAERGSTRRPSAHLTPTKKFARELAENPSWQRAVMVRKLAEKLGMSEDDALEYALMRTLEEETSDKQG